MRGTVRTSGWTTTTRSGASGSSGATRERQRIIGNLRASRLTVLYAESGVGKSSLLRAGVAARLRELAHARAAERGSPGYIPLVFSVWRDEPTGQLIGEIEQAIKPFLPQGSSVELPPRVLEQGIEAAHSRDDATLLIILDQFEEYFLYSARESREGRFADELSRCVGREDLRANFLIALREDAYAGLGDHFKGRIANVYRNYLNVQYLDREAARDAIRNPILEVYNKQKGIEPFAIEEQLVTAVLDQVRAQQPVSESEPHVPGSGGNGDGRVATPLLQLVMEAIWRQERSQGSHTLRLSTLESLEGVEQIVDTHLKKALEALGEEDRATAIDVFDHLVTPSGGKIAEPIPDLAHRTGHTEEQVSAVLGKLDERRIVRSVPAPPGRDAQRFRRYEIFHDVLAPAINRVIATHEEERHAREQRQREAAEKREREQREAAETARESARKFRRLARVVLALLVLMSIAVIGALIAWRSAVNDKETAQSVGVAASAEQVVGSDPQLSTLLALKALQVHYTPQAAQALRDVLPQMQVQRTLSRDSAGRQCRVQSGPEAGCDGAGQWAHTDLGRGQPRARPIPRSSRPERTRRARLQSEQQAAGRGVR